ncbi:hypothetical protein [Flavobacterium cyanobacteriorum]|nr:hypothetical protein [Flavobacterium cyanobacteriorum]
MMSNSTYSLVRKYLVQHDKAGREVLVYRYSPDRSGILRAAALMAARRYS